MEKVSVLLPTYNVESYIEEAVFSILNQSYGNLEIIIVDDFSTDNTYKILKELSQKDDRIKLYRNKSNMKICYTLNKALKYSSGEFIARMDGDDISEYDRLEKQIEYLKENPQIDLVGTSVIGINEEGNEIGRTRYIESYDLLKKVSLIASPVSHIWVARRYIYESLEGYREMPYVEDYDFLLRMVTQGYKFSNISNYYGYRVRIRNGNTASTVGAKQRKAFEYARNLYKERRKNGKDFFDKNKFYDYMQVSGLENYKYDCSLRLLQKAITLKSVKDPKWLIYILLAGFKSKLQFKYLYRSLLLRILNKIDQSEILKYFKK